MRNRNGLILMLAGFAAVAPAQQGQVAGPVAGYVFDGGAHAVRPVLGIPGASILGPAVPLGYTVTAATVSPRGDAALAVADDGSAHLLRLSSGAATEVPMNGAPGKPERVVFSPSGTAVALITGSRAVVFGGLPDAATLAAAIDLPAAGPAQVAVQSARRPVSGVGPIALTDDGAWLLLAANGSAQLVGAGGAHSIAIAARGSQVAFAPGSHDAAIADARGSLVLIRSADGPAASTTLSADAAKGAAGLAFSADGKSLLVAANQGVTVFDLASGTPTSVSCNCTATALVRMGSVYRLNELGSGPLWVLDPVGARIVFVPAGGAE